MTREELRVKAAQDGVNSLLPTITDYEEWLEKYICDPWTKVEDDPKTTGDYLCELIQLEYSHIRPYIKVVGFHKTYGWEYDHIESEWKIIRWMKIPQ